MKLENKDRADKLFYRLREAKELLDALLWDNQYCTSKETIRIAFKKDRNDTYRSVDVSEETKSMLFQISKARIESEIEAIKKEIESL